MQKSIRTVALMSVLSLTFVPMLIAEPMGTDPRPQRPKPAASVGVVAYTVLSFLVSKSNLNERRHESHDLDNVFWAAGLIGHVALLSILVLRGRWRNFPVFTALIAYHALVTLVLFAISRLGGYKAYDVAYWSAAAGSFGLQLALIYEMAKIVLRPTGTWVRDARKSFLLWSGLGVLVAAVAAGAVTPAASSSLETFEVRGLLFTSLLTCEVFLAMSAAANRLGLQWRSHVMALGQGLTAWALMALMSDAAHIALGWNRDFAVIDHIRILFYLGALAFWIGSFWLPEQERAPISPDMREYIVALHSRVQYDLDRLAALKKPLL